MLAPANRQAWPRFRAPTLSGIGAALSRAASAENSFGQYCGWTRGGRYEVPIPGGPSFVMPPWRGGNALCFTAKAAS